jgi:hypothetical protein
VLLLAGEDKAVLDVRRLWQGVMRSDCSREIEGLTGRKVIGFMSDNHIDPDIAVEVFILQPVGEDPAVQAAIAVADQRPRDRQAHGDRAGDGAPVGRLRESVAGRLSGRRRVARGNDRVVD